MVGPDRRLAADRARRRLRGRVAGAGRAGQPAGAERRDLGAPGQHRAPELPAEHARARARRRVRRAGDRGRHGVAGQHVHLPRPPPVRMGAAAAARRPGLHHRLHLHRSPGVRRAGARPAARGDRLDPRRLLVPADPLARRRDRGHEPRALPLRLSARARRVPRAVHLHARRQPDAWPRAMGQLLRDRGAAGPAGDRRRRRARADGDPRRLRHRAVLRRRHLHDRHLSHLVRARRADCGRAARRRADAVRAARAHARARQQGARQVSAHRAVAPALDLSIERPARPARELRLRAAGGARLRRPGAGPARHEPAPGRRHVRRHVPRARLEQLRPRGARRRR